MDLCGRNVRHWGCCCLEPDGGGYSALLHLHMACTWRTERSTCVLRVVQPRAVRAAQLLETKHFPCACSRCAAPLATSPDRFLEVWGRSVLVAPDACTECAALMSIAPHAVDTHPGHHSAGANMSASEPAPFFHSFCLHHRGCAALRRAAAVSW